MDSELVKKGSEEMIGEIEGDRVNAGNTRLENLIDGEAEVPMLTERENAEIEKGNEACTGVEEDSRCLRYLFRIRDGAMLTGRGLWEGVEWSHWAASWCTDV